MKVVEVKGGQKVKVVDGDKWGCVSSRDIEMDKRAQQAVQAAVEKAKFCKKPIAMYDKTSKKAYIQYADGVKKYVE